MSQPCLDSYSTRFGDFSDLVQHHENLTKHSRWERLEVKNIRVAPCDKDSKLFSDISQFEPGISQDAVEDTAENLGLAIKLGSKHIPVRTTAYKSLLDRAKISGTVLGKLERRKLSGVLNSCLGVHNSDALLLIRDEKIAACHSGDEKDYARMDIDQLLNGLGVKLDDKYPGNQFNFGYADHAITSAEFLLPDQKEDLLGAYATELAARGNTAMAAKIVPGIRFMSSDTGISSAKISALLFGLQYPIHIGSAIAVHHRGQSKVEDFIESLDMLFAKMGKTYGKLVELMDVDLEYPVNAMTRICKKLSMPKKAAVAAIALFEMTYGGGTATAHDVFVAMQEIIFNLRTEHISENKLLTTEENLARALWFRWSDYDLAKAVEY